MSAGEAVSIADFSPLPTGAEQYPVEFIDAQGTIVLRKDETGVLVGVTERTPKATLDLVRTFHREPVSFVEINPMELSSWLGSKLGEDAGGAASGEIALDDKVLLDRLANDAPVINFVNSICIDGIRSGASDIHIEAGTDSVRVRYRLDGALRTVKTVEPSRFAAISSRIKIMANLNILERRQPQDGRISVSVGVERVDLRVSIVPVAGGESIVLRILGKSVAHLALAELGFDGNQLAVIRKLLRVPHGLVLVTGPTGSGKTTTLNAMLRELVSDSVNIVTIEDPVEFIVPGVNQIQINEQIGLGFDTILRRILRQDPNVIMVGEIRDAATAEIALRAALTGHLVLSTLHTNDAVSAIARLMNMGVEPYLIASVLRGVIAQRLVRRLCPDCRVKRGATPSERSMLEESSVNGGFVFDATGCPSCADAGYRGRVLVAEAFLSDAGLEELIIEGTRTAALAAYLADAGMVTLAGEAAAKISAGETTFREAGKEIAFDGGDF